MALATVVEGDMSAVLGIKSCGGEQRIGGDRGVGTITGTSKLSAVAGPCRVYLLEEHGKVIGYRRSSNSGAYSFIGLPVGRYSILIADDLQGAKRSKVEHVELT